jgi:hypothetical protein
MNQKIEHTTLAKSSVNESKRFTCAISWIRTERSLSLGHPVAPGGRRIIGFKVLYVKGTLHADDVSTCMFLRIPKFFERNATVFTICLLSIDRQSAQILMMPIFPNITLVIENMMPAIHNTTKNTAHGKISPVDWTVSVIVPIPDADCVRAPSSLYIGVTASKMRTASEDDLVCTSRLKKSGETIKKRTGIRTTMKRMASHTVCLKLDDNFFKLMWSSVAMINKKVLFKKTENRIEMMNGEMFIKDILFVPPKFLFFDEIDEPV